MPLHETEDGTYQCECDFCNATRVITPIDSFGSWVLFGDSPNTRMLVGHETRPLRGRPLRLANGLAFCSGACMAEYVGQALVRHRDALEDAKEDDSCSASYWGADGRCIHCGAGNDAHHSYTCPTNKHPDRLE